MRGKTPTNVLSPLVRVVTAGALLALSGHGVAGLVDPGNPPLFWTESINDSWHVPGNWSTNAVPGGASTPVITDANANIFLNGNTANLSTLYLGHHRALSTNGHTLQITSAPGNMVITGVETQLFVANGGAGHQVNINNMHIQNDGRLELAGGSARVLNQITAFNGGRVIGHGTLRVDSNNPAALNMHFAAPLSVSGGNMMVQVFGGGSFAPPQDILVTQPNRQLTVNAPLFLPVRNLTLGSGSSAGFNQPWTVTGQITGQAGSGNVAAIHGNGALTMDGGFAVTSGQLTVQPNTTLATGSSINLSGGLGNNAILRLNGTTHSEAGQNTTLGFNSRLRIEGPVPDMWLGNINSSAGILEPNTSTGFWRVSGDMNLGSFAGLRTRLDGNVITRAYGQVNVTGIGAVLDSPLTLQQFSSTHIAAPTTLLINNSDFRHFSGNVTGDGRIVNNPTGTLHISDAASVAVDIENSGAFNAGYLDNQISQIEIDGDYTQTDTGRLVVNINPSGTQHDRYWFSGTAVLGGQVQVVAGGYVPQVGDSFEVLVADGGVSGTFDAVTGGPGFVAVYGPNNVVLEFVGDIVTPGCPGDLTGDGQVDADDLGVLLAAFGVSADGDLNGDGVTDADDLGILLASFGSACTQ